MFEDMFIPWTPRLGLRKTASAQPPPPAEPPPPAPAQVCPRTLHIARAIVNHAIEPFPEVARAISAAFIAYIRGELTLNLSGDPSTWAVTHALT